MGVDIEADGAVIAGGTPLADVVVFRNWNAARRLVERGATAAWQAAALGGLARVRGLARAEPATGPGEITNALWRACHGGQRPVATYVLELGANINWVGHEGRTFWRPRVAAAPMSCRTR